MVINSALFSYFYEVTGYELLYIAFLNIFRVFTTLMCSPAFRFHSTFTHMEINQCSPAFRVHRY